MINDDSGDFYKEKKTSEEKNRFVNFYLNSEWYGIEIRKVTQVVKCPAITTLPGIPSPILGIINLRGNILSVTDLGGLFGLSYAESFSENWLVVIEENEVQTGLLVHSKVAIIAIPFSKIDPPLTTLSQPFADYIEGEAELNGKLLGILKVEKILQRRIR